MNLYRRTESFRLQSVKLETNGKQLTMTVNTDGATKSDVSEISRFPCDISASDFAVRYFKSLKNLEIYVTELHHLPPITNQACITVMQDRCVDVYGRTVVSHVNGVKQLQTVMKPWDFYIGYTEGTFFNIVGGCDDYGILYELKVSDVRRGPCRFSP